MANRADRVFRRDGDARGRTSPLSVLRQPHEHDVRDGSRHGLARSIRPDGGRRRPSRVPVRARGRGRRPRRAVRSRPPGIVHHPTDGRPLHARTEPTRREPIPRRAPGRRQARAASGAERVELHRYAAGRARRHGEPLHLLPGAAIPRRSRRRGGFRRAGDDDLRAGDSRRARSREAEAALRADRPERGGSRRGDRFPALLPHPVGRELRRVRRVPAEPLRPAAVPDPRLAPRALRAVAGDGAVTATRRSIRSRTIDLDGPVHYADFGGDGATMVLVHGLGGAYVNWLGVGAALAERARVLAPDLAGFGRTPLAGRSATVRANRALLARFVDAVAGEPVILVGNSMGGLISMIEAAERPHMVRGLVLVGPAQPLARGGVDALVTAAFAAYGLPLVGGALLRARAALQT